MNRPPVITLLTRGDDLEQHVPVGFAIVDEMYAEAGMRDSISAGDVEPIQKRVRILQQALRQEFGGRARLRILNPWTPYGLWFAVSHRLREFPVIVIGKQRFPIDASLETLIEAVR